MLTVIHIAIYLLAYARISKKITSHPEKMNDEMQWILLPDMMEYFIGNSVVSHFRKGMTETSWIKFPDASSLQLLTKKAAKARGEYKMAKGSFYGEISMELFEMKNYTNLNFHEIKGHLLREKFFEDFLLKEVVERNGNIFILKKNKNITYNKDQFEQELNQFQNYWFLYLVGKIYSNNYFLLNQEWIDREVVSPLKDSYYPIQLQEMAKKKIRIPSEIEEMINNKDFEYGERIFDMTPAEVRDAWDYLNYNMLNLTESQMLK